MPLSLKSVLQLKLAVLNVDYLIKRSVIVVEYSRHVSDCCYEEVKILWLIVTCI